MTARAARFTQADITRALRGAAKAGVQVAVRIDIDGAMVLTPCDPVAAPPVAKDDLMNRITRARL